MHSFSSFSTEPCLLAPSSSVPEDNLAAFISPKKKRLYGTDPWHFSPSTVKSMLLQEKLEMKKFRWLELEAFGNQLNYKGAIQMLKA